MKYTYIVTSGEYSDYRINAVFDTKQLAEKYISSFKSSGYDSPEIEVHNLNPYKEEITKGYFAFFVRMTKEGECKDVHISTSSYGFDNPNAGFDVNDNMYVHVFAKDEKHAIKITNEKRTQLIALNKWGRK
jgi:hypothetical protein